MRVLWFTNIPIITNSVTISDIRTSGGWMLALLLKLRESGNVQIAVATTHSGNKLESYVVDGVQCYLIPGGSAEAPSSQEKALYCCERLVQDWAPDIIHIHGTERFFGLLGQRKNLNVPIVISVQGLMVPYSEWFHYFGHVTMKSFMKMHRLIEPFVLRGQFWSFLKYRRAAAREKIIIKENQNFFGRTLWDRSHVLGINPNAKYFKVGELLREPFWEKQWSVDGCQRNRIIFTNAGHPRKGTEVLLQAVELLKNDFPEIEVCIAGQISTRSGYGRYLSEKLDKLAAHVKLLGPLNAVEMAEELANAHAFVSPSFIDNSPNSVCEAQVVGLPVIASYTGGVPSLITENETGLFFPNGDAYVLAQMLRRIFLDDQLASKLGSNGRDEARNRHDPDTILKQLKQAYQETISSFEKS